MMINLTKQLKRKNEPDGRIETSEVELERVPHWPSRVRIFEYGSEVYRVSEVSRNNGIEFRSQDADFYRQKYLDLRGIFELREREYFKKLLLGWISTQRSSTRRSFSEPIILNEYLDLFDDMFILIYDNIFGGETA